MPKRTLTAIARQGADVLATFDLYLRAYLRSLFRGAPWVTVVSLALFVLFLAVPQAAELVLSQMTVPPAADLRVNFYVREACLVGTSLLAAFAIWLAARMLIDTDWAARRQDGTGAPAAIRSYRDSPSDWRSSHAADVHACVYVPRILGLSVFVALILAAARNLSEEGYYLPIGLTIVWLAAFAMLCMRIARATAKSMQAWGIVLAVLAAIYCGGAWIVDWRWVSDHGTLDVLWQRQQQQRLSVMGGAALMGAAFIGLSAGWLSGRARALWHWGATFAIGVLALVALEIAKQPIDLGVYIFFIAQATCAIAYWCIVVYRKRGYTQLRDSLDASLGGSRWRKLMEIGRGEGRWIVAGLVLLTTAGLFALALRHPIYMGRLLGDLGIVLAFLSSFLLVIAAIQAGLGRSTWRVAVPASFVVLALLAYFIQYPTEPEAPVGRVRAGSASAGVAPLAPIAKDGNLVAIAAHGGGIRAALYTAAFMAWLDHYTQYAFSDRLVAASGASGGSIGLAVWASARAAGCKEKELAKEQELAKKQEADPDDLPACVQAVNEVLAQDHLAPVLATALFRDYLLFLAPPARGGSLYDSLITAAGEVGKRLRLEGLQSQLEAPLSSCAYPLLLNSAIVGTAIPYSFASRQGMLPLSPPSPGGYFTYVASTSSSRLSLLEAAIHSARFPVISPKGLVRADGPTVVDGGYFDNSGVVVLRQHLLGLLQESGDKAGDIKSRLFVISLDNEPITAQKPHTAIARRNSSDEVLGTALSARGAHGAAAWHQLCTEIGDATQMLSARPGAPIWQGCRWPTELDEDDGQPLWKHQIAAHGPALGWYLSSRSARHVTLEAREKAYAAALFTGLLQREPAAGAAIRRGR